eukprot:Opistho-2@21695
MVANVPCFVATSGSTVPQSVVEQMEPMQPMGYANQGTDSAERVHAAAVASRVVHLYFTASRLGWDSQQCMHLGGDGGRFKPVLRPGAVDALAGLNDCDVTVISDITMRLIATPAGQSTTADADTQFRILKLASMIFEDETTNCDQAQLDPSANAWEMSADGIHDDELFSTRTWSGTSDGSADFGPTAAELPSRDAMYRMPTLVHADHADADAAGEYHFAAALRQAVYAAAATQKPHELHDDDTIASPFDQQCVGSAGSDSLSPSSSSTTSNDATDPFSDKGKLAQIAVHGSISQAGPVCPFCTRTADGPPPCYRDLTRHLFCHLDGFVENGLSGQEVLSLFHRLRYGDHPGTTDTRQFWQKYYAGLGIDADASDRMDHMGVTIDEIIAAGKQLSLDSVPGRKSSIFACKSAPRGTTAEDCVARVLSTMQYLGREAKSRATKRYSAATEAPLSFQRFVSIGWDDTLAALDSIKSGRSRAISRQQSMSDTVGVGIVAVSPVTQTGAKTARRLSASGQCAIQKKVAAAVRAATAATAAGVASDKRN